MIDITAIEKEARAQIAEEQSTKAKGALVQALRKVELARQNLRSAEIQLEDIKAQIADGTLPA